MPPRRGPMMGSTLSGVMNATAASDEEARASVKKWFGGLLALLLLIDLGSAVAAMVLQCQESEHDITTRTCVTDSLKAGWRWNPIDGNKTNAHGYLGDVVWLAACRCITTLVLLYYGVKLGKEQQKSNEEEETETNNTTTNSNDSLTEPLLSSNSDETPDLVEEDNNDNNDTNENNDAANQPSSWYHKIYQHLRHIYQQPRTPSQIQTMTLVSLFFLSTLYQVYAGLKVATWSDDHHSHPAVVLLLCLTVLWINAQAHVFRTLQSELTRPDGVFLQNLHRHPLYKEANRGLAMHWCDLCHKRIEGGECYRCALCDWDLCTKCAARGDAREVGEHVLRSDRGVREDEGLTTTGYLKRSIQVAGSEWKWLVLSFVLLALSSLTQLLLPHFQGRIIDQVIPKPGDDHPQKGFHHYIIIYVWIMIAQGAVSTLYSALLTLVSRRLKFTIRNALLEQILIQDVAYFDGTESGRLISRLTNDLDLMMAPIQSSLSSLLRNLLILFGGMVFCFAKSYRLSMLAFVSVGPITSLWNAYAQWSRGLAREMLSFWAEGSSIAAQALSHVRTVKAFGCESTVLQKYSDINQQALYCGIKDAWGNGLTSALTGYLDLGAGVLILYFGGLLVYRGEMTVGDLVTYQLFWNMMNSAYQNLQGLVTSFTRSAAGAEKIFSLWDSEPDINPKQGADVDWEIQGKLSLEKVQFYYQMRPDNIVLQDFSLEIPAGKTMALVGRSGGGKSTIINLLLRFYDPKQGKLQLDGRDYDSLKVQQLRHLFGVVTQETELFALTVEENIAYGLNKEDYTLDEVMEAAKKAYAHDFIMDMKDGYQTRIGERGNRLSGGQRQRLAIARVFLRRPKIILLDEATSALDEHSQEAVQQALANLIKESNATVVLVAHRLSTVVNADSICVIDKGQVLEQGNHDELVQKGGIYASMVSKQLSKKADMLEQDGKDKPAGQETAADDIDALLAESDDK